MHILRRFYALVGFAFLLFGVFWLPKNYSDSGEAAKPWMEFLSMVGIDQYTALWAFAIAALLYIFWMDIRPFWRRWREGKKKPPIGIGATLYCEAHYIDGLGADRHYYLNTFYIPVQNNQDSAATLRRVKCHIYHLGDSTLVAIKGSEESSIDIRSGEVAYFELGRLASDQNMGAVQGRAEIPTADAKLYAHNLPQGSRNFEIYSHSGKRERILAYAPNTRDVFEMTAIVTADDVPPRHIKLTVKRANTTTPLRYGSDLHIQDEVPSLHQLPGH